MRQIQIPPTEAQPPARPAARSWLAALGVVAVCTGISELIMSQVDLAEIIMVYLAGVVIVSLRSGTVVSVATVLLSIFLFDLMYVPPRWGLNPIYPSHMFTLGVMLAVGLLISSITAYARRQSELAEQRARDAQALLDAAEAERQRSTLLSGVSHDLRTPLATIIGAATSLLEQGDRLDAAGRRSLAGSILGEAHRLHRRVSHLLDLTRMEEGAVQPQREWCPADDLVSEALQPLGTQETHPLRIDVPEDAVVWCDAHLVEQAIANLVDNARRHTPAGTGITVSVRAGEAEWMLQVSDTGPGLPAGAEERVFHRYERLAAAGQRAAGFGLGLAICAAIARLHGGTIAARNAPGAEFTMRLPQPPREPLPAEEPA